MSTQKQKAAVKDLSENIRKPLGEIMRQNDYSISTSESPQRLTESKGFKEEMKNYGLTEELIASSLVEDIELKPQNRIQELNLGAKILKMTDEDKGTDQTNVFIKEITVKVNDLLP